LPVERARARAAALRRTAGAELLAGGEDARLPVAAVRRGGARAARVHAAAAAVQVAAAVGDARRAVAAVARERARRAFHLAARAKAVAARHAERVELTHAGVADGAAAVVTRRRVSARLVVLVVADVALGVARLRVAAHADGIGVVLLEALHVAIAGQAGAGRAAAVAIGMADVAVDAAALGGLADLHAGRRVGLAQAAAAIATAGAHRAVDAGRAQRAAGHRMVAEADRVAGHDVAEIAAALVVVRARIAVLDAVRRRAAHVVRVAQGRAAIAVAAARVAVGLAARVERGAGAVAARAAAAFAVVRARRAVGRALLVGAHAVDAAHRAAVGVRRARGTGHAADRRVRGARALRIADAGTAAVAGRAGGAVHTAWMRGVGAVARFLAAAACRGEEQRDDRKSKPHGSIGPEPGVHRN